MGFLWSLVNPLLMMLVYYIVFVVLLPTSAPQGCTEAPPPGANTDQLQASVTCRIYNHFAAFILIGILAWNFTGGSVMTAMGSLVNSGSVIKKIYFPREVLPVSAVLAQLVNFLLALIPLFVVLLISGIVPTGYLLLLPIILFFHMLFLIGLALIFSIVSLYFRDMMVIMEVLLQAWFFLSPVIYSMKQVYKDGAGIVYWLNPMASFIESYRTLLFFDYAPELGFTIRTCLYGLVTFFVGYAFFMKHRRKIGELI